MKTANIRITPALLLRAALGFTAVLALTPARAELPQVTPVVTFTGNLADGTAIGANPAMTLVETPDGQLYAQTAYGAGTSILHNLGGDGGSFSRFDPLTRSYVVLDRANPGNLTVTADGTIYGTTDGLRRYTVGSGWTVLKTLATAVDGVNPPALWTEGADGRLFGTSGDHLFAINKDGTGFIRLHTGTAALGRSPGRLISHSNGSLYGMALTGGVPVGATGRGVLFRIQPDGTGYTKIHEFNGIDGNLSSSPARGTLVEGSDGRLYGVANYGQSTENTDPTASNGGRLFRVDADGANFTVLHSFSRANANTDGRRPYSLIQAQDGHLYGVTYEGGIDYHGVIFRWHSTAGYQTLYTFAPINGPGRNRTRPDGSPASNNYGSNLDGIEPRSLIQTRAGEFFGVANRGSEWGWGNIFRFTPGDEVPVFKFIPKLDLFAGGVSTRGEKRVAVGTPALLAWRGLGVSNCQASTTETGGTTFTGPRGDTMGSFEEQSGTAYDGEAMTPQNVGTWEYRLTCDTPEDGPIQDSVTIKVEAVDLPEQQVGGGGAMGVPLLGLFTLLAGLRLQRARVRGVRS